MPGAYALSSKNESLEVEHRRFNYNSVTGTFSYKNTSFLTLEALVEAIRTGANAIDQPCEGSRFQKLFGSIRASCGYIQDDTEEEYQMDTS